MNLGTSILALLIAVIASFPAMAAEPKKDRNLSDINTLVEISLQGRDKPEQMVKRVPIDSATSFTFNPDPVEVKAGTRWKLRVTRSEADGQTVDVTNSKHLKFFSTFYKAHLCGTNELCVWPDKDSAQQSGPATLGAATLEVEYNAPEGKIGFNGIRLNIVADAEKAPGGESAATDSLPIGPILTSVGEADWKAAFALRGIDVKRHPSDVTQMVVFFDANCPFSARLWSAMYGPRADERLKQLASRWIPVAYMGPTSNAKGAYLLRRNSFAALAGNFDHFDYKNRTGSAPEDTSTQPAVSRQLRQNLATLTRLSPGTPTIVFRAADGTRYVRKGLPSAADLEVILAHIAPAQLPKFNR